MLVKGVVFRLETGLPSEVKSLLEDFRLAVNNAIRAGLQARVTSRNALNRIAYKDFRHEYPRMYAQHLVSAFEVAGSVLKNHRRLVRKGVARRIPYVRRLMMKAENQAYKLDRESGTVDLPIRAGCHVKLNLIVSQYHRKYLDDSTLSLGSLTLLSDRVMIAFRKVAPAPYTPASVLSLDTNERSLDGVFVDSHSEAAVTVKAEFPDVAIIQHRHHDRRRRLQRKKAHDRRTARNLCRREGTREHHRIEYRLHQVADAVLSLAEDKKSAVVLEDLTGIRYKRGKDLNRRLGLWPRRKLHQIIEYKAQWKGIPVVKVDPRYSSRKCPACGRIQDSRMGTEFVCECGWHLDRHINASINLLQTAISNGMAGGLRFDPGAFQHDVV
ncbi:MAG: transposase, partial [Candidatus Thermoplasmatota archaeon]|nr:transposase [Candidatus Thermoplasmatota archaeon]MBU1915472.1 transposase [Candidatus Thermoplasmatota archaeon]